MLWFPKPKYTQDKEVELGSAMWQSHILYVHHPAQPKSCDSHSINKSSCWNAIYGTHGCSICLCSSSLCFSQSAYQINQRHLKFLTLTFPALALVNCYASRIQVWLFRTNLNTFVLWCDCDTDLFCLKHSLVFRRASLEGHKAWFMSWAWKSIPSQGPLQCFFKCLSWSSSIDRDLSVVMDTMAGG